MKNEDLLRVIDILHRDLGIPTENFFLKLEDAVSRDVRKHLAYADPVVTSIDRNSASISLRHGGRELPLAELEHVVDGACARTLRDMTGEVIRRRRGETL